MDTKPPGIPENKLVDKEARETTKTPNTDDTTLWYDIRNTRALEKENMK